MPRIEAPMAVVNHALDQWLSSPASRTMVTAIVMTAGTRMSREIEG